MIPNKPYPIVAGPTASGKTALAIELAKRLGGEVVSADSMQVYDQVWVGTARPMPEEMDGIPHHLMGFLPLDSKYSVAQYLTDANRVFADVYGRDKLPVLCGGTGLYIQSFMENIRLFEEEPDPERRRMYVRLAEEQGNEALLERLRLVDPDSAARLHVNDRNRIIRALEVYDTTGLTITQQTQRSHGEPSPYTPCLFVLDFRDRQALYDRINRRVSVMLEQGLLDEAARILATNPDATVTQAIGYKEFSGYFDGTITLDEASDRLRQQTRRYAKRQLSWFRRMTNAIRLYVDDYPSPQALAEAALKHYQEFTEGGAENGSEKEA